MYETLQIHLGDVNLIEMHRVRSTRTYTTPPITVYLHYIAEFTLFHTYWAIVSRFFGFSM